jgi:hypothetical protein
MRRYSTILDKRLVVGLYAAGATAVALALSANALGLAASSELSLRGAVLLIAGCDLIVAALVASAHRMPAICDAGVSLTSLLSGAIADAVMMFAISAAAVIALFGNGKPIERVGYCLATLVLIPLCATLAWRRQRMGSTDERQRFVAFATLASTACALWFARLLVLPATGAIGTSLFVLLELVAARAVIALAGHAIPATWLNRFPASTALAATPALLAVIAGPFIPPATFGFVDIAVPLSAGLAAFFLVVARQGRRGLPRIGARAVDASILTVSSLVVTYLGRPSPELAENHNYFLGPALDVLHGHPMLVSTFSQYGVGVIYALAAVFLVVPIGYGTFTLLLSGLTALFFTVFYVVLRWSTKSQLVAVIGLTTVVVLDMFGQIDFYAYVPSTGVLRFGLPWLVILCSLAAVRTARHKRLFEALVLAIVAVAAVWSGETGVYCLGTAGALACLSAALTDGSARDRVRMGTLRVALLIATWACSVLVFTLVMRMATGVWPNWGGYLEYIHLYTVSDFGDLPIEPWSPGLAIGGIYTVSAIVIVLLVLTRPALVRERAVAFRAATGLTVLGALVYTYFLGRSHPNNLVHISPPAIALLSVWFDVARSTGSSRVAAGVASATAVFFGAMVVANQSRNISQKYTSTALAAVLGVSPPLDAEVRALWHNPVVDPAAAQVVEFVKSLGGEHASLTLLMSPAIVSEALLRLDMANAVGSSNPLQESISPQAPGRVSAAVRSLRPGGILVISETGEVLPIQRYAFALLQARFALREIGADGQGLRAFRMTAPA